MITNTGKDILARYLIGKAPAYASYIAFGCGAKPKLANADFSSQELDNFAAKKSLDFEMFRAPIISRGYVNDGNVSEIVFTAEIPTTERYEITEVGIFSAASNPSAVGNDSRLLVSFANSENWQLHGGSPSSIQSLSTKTERLDGNGDGVITVSDTAFFASSDNPALIGLERRTRFETARFLTNTLFVRGDLSTISGESSSALSYSAGEQHIHLTNISPSLDASSADDEIRMVFSVVGKSPSQTNASNVKIIVEFASSDESTAQYARLKHYAVPDASNRYIYVSKKISELETSSGFSWNLVNIIKIYVSVADKSSNYYLALDAIRFENTTSLSPIYGLTGYTVIKNTIDNIAQPIIKLSNTTNMLEFRFAMDVI